MKKTNESTTKICKYCRSEIDAKATICPHCRKRQPQKGTGFVIIFGALAVFIILCVGMANDGTSMEEQVGDAVDEATITIDEYNQIENGMSKEQVEEIVGSEGEMQSTSEAAGITVDMYVWYGDKAGSDAVVTFTNGEVSAKTEINLD